MVGGGIIPFLQPSSSTFKGKITAQMDKKSHRKMQSREETEAPRETWGCGNHHSLTVAATMACGGL